MNKKELLAAGVTFPSSMMSLTENNAHYLDTSLSETAVAYPFDFSNLSSSNPLKFNEVTSGEKDLIIPKFVDTLKPVISNS